MSEPSTPHGLEPVSDVTLPGIRTRHQSHQDGVRLNIRGRSVKLRGQRRRPTGILRWLLILGPGLVAAAAAQGMTTLALTDAANPYGAPRFHHACKAAGMRAIHGVEVTTTIDNRARWRDVPHAARRAVAQGLRHRAAAGQGDQEPAPARGLKNTRRFTNGLRAIPRRRIACARPAAA